MEDRGASERTDPLLGSSILGAKNYDICFSGKLDQKRDVEEIKSNLRKLFKDDSINVSHFFEGKKFYIRRRVDYQTALGYLNILEKSGLICFTTRSYPEKTRTIDDGNVQEVLNSPSVQEKKRCVKCNHPVDPFLSECPKCGIIFSKYAEVHASGRNADPVQEGNSFQANGTVDRATNSKKRVSKRSKILFALIGTAVVILTLGYIFNVFPFYKKRIMNELQMEFVYLYPGTFMMGSKPSEPGRDNDEGYHRVTLTKGFYIQTTEVTQTQWKKIMGTNPSKFRLGVDRPVESVSWNDVQEFIRRLNEKQGESIYRLPTEAEWEYASKAGSETRFAFGDCLQCTQANFNCRNFLYTCPQSIAAPPGRTTPVKSYAPNALGIFDMHGNVYEWCQDWYGEYPEAGVVDPTGPSFGRTHVSRGGSWFTGDKFCRSADRNGDAPGYGGSFIGFRLVRQP